MAAYAALLSYAPARRYFAVFCQSSAGTGLGYVALLLLAYQQRHSPWMVTAVLLADYLPSMLFGALIGAVVDRVSRRTCAVLGDLLGAGAFIGLAVAPTAPAVFALALVAGIGSAVSAPAMMAAMPGLVRPRDLPAATSLYNAIEKFGFVLGPLLAGGLLLIGDVRLLMLLNGATFLLSAAVVTTLHFGAAPAGGDDEPATPASARAGLAALRDMPDVAAMVVGTGAVSLCFSLFAVCEVIFATDALRLSGSAFSLLAATMSVSMTVGALSGSRTRDGRTCRARYVQGMVLLGAGLGVAAVSGALWLVVVGYLLAGYGNGRQSTHDRLLLSRTVPDAIQGRVFALRYSLMSWGTAIGFAVGGGLVALVGARAFVAAAAVGILVTWALVSLRLRALPVSGEPRAQGA